MKPALRSKTILGVLVAITPQLVHLCGVEVSDGEVAAILDAAMTLGGAAYAIYGRVTAAEGISGLVR